VKPPSRSRRRSGKATNLRGVQINPMRIKGIEPDNPPELIKPIFDLSRERFGRVISPNLAMGHCPEILLAAAGLGGAISGSNTVEPHLKVAASLRAAQMIGCPF
jgi:hypothetical protein